MKRNASTFLALAALVTTWPGAVRAAAPSITRQPVHLTVTPGAYATFTVGATGTATLRFQWRRDGTNLPGATEPAYTTDPILMAVTNRYSVVISNNSGAVTSQSVTSRLAYLTGMNTLVATGSVWRYRDNGTDQGTLWRAPVFNDASWSSGPAELGYGEGDEATVVSYGTNAGNRYITTYFRRGFSVTNAPAVSNACLVVERDDGAAVYLNGTEVFRENLPRGTLTYTNLALSGTEGLPRLTNYFDPGWLVTGSNVLATEVHQTGPTSSDLSFDLALYRDQTATAGLTRGRLICVDNRPLTNVLVVVELRTNNVQVDSFSDFTDSNGNFQVMFACVNVGPAAEFRVYSTGCPSEEWTIPTTTCYADLGLFVCRECAPSTRVPPRVALWLPFDEPPGPIAENLIGRNNGTLFNGTNIAVLSGGPARSNGFVRTSLRFDALNDYVQVPPYPELWMGLNNFSIVAWVKAEVNESVPRVLVELLGPGRGGVHGYSLRFAGAGLVNRLALYLADGTGSNFVSSLGVPADGRWHHVAVTVDRNNHTGLRFYLDGTAEESTHNPTARMNSVTPAAGVPLRIGSSSVAVSNVFRGNLDEVAIFARALTAMEIRTIARARSFGLTQARACAPRVVLSEAAGLAPLGLAPGPLGPSSTNTNTKVTTEIQVCNSTASPQAFCIMTDAGSSPVVTPCLQPGCCVPVSLTVNAATAGGSVHFNMYQSQGPCGSSTALPTTVPPFEVTVPAVSNQNARVLPAAGFALAPATAAATIIFEVVNNAGMELLGDYKVSALNPNLDPLLSPVVLSGETGGMLSVPANGSKLLTVQAEYEPDPTVLYTVLLEIDAAGAPVEFVSRIAADLITELPPTCEVQIMEQPADAFPPTNSSVTFHVVAVADPEGMSGLTYRWRKNGVPLLVNAIGHEYTIPNVTLADEGAYDVIVMDGCGALRSSAARLLTLEGLRLNIAREGTNVHLWWPEKLFGFVLIETDALPAHEPDWTPVPGYPSLENGYFHMHVSTEEMSMRFFQLHRFGATTEGCDCD